MMPKSNFFCWTFLFKTHLSELKKALSEHIAFIKGLNLEVSFLRTGCQKFEERKSKSQ